MGPEFLVAVEPLHRLFHWSGVQAAEHGPAGLGTFDEAGIGQHIEMLHHRRQRDGEGARQVADRNTVLFDHAGEQGPTCGIRKGGKGAVEVGIFILNH